MNPGRKCQVCGGLVSPRKREVHGIGGFTAVCDSCGSMGPHCATPAEARRHYHRLNRADHHAEACAWMLKNPDALDKFRELALEAQAAGRRFGWKLLAEVVRHHMWIRVGDTGFRINNNHIRYIGARLEREHPGLTALTVRKGKK